ncbi:MAG: hypothetical protein VX904_02035, partial [Planctomycetota bacterium]|nr:hypothetical protein [Planctomycetota bacterium]
IADEGDKNAQQKRNHRKAEERSGSSAFFCAKQVSLTLCSGLTFFSRRPFRLENQRLALPKVPW